MGDFKQGNRFGGNRKGIPNKKTQMLRELTQSKAEDILDHAYKTIELVKEPYLRAQLWLKFLELILPKPKVEEDEGNKEILVYDRFQSMSPEKIKELVKHDLAADEKTTKKEE